MKNVIKHKISDSHDEWLKQRNKGIGGSDVGTILGFNKFKSAYTLWAEKSGQVPAKEVDNEHVRVGHDLEDYVAKRFTEATGKRVKKSGYSFQSKEYPFMLANVDRLIIGENAGLECKTASARTSVDYKNGDIPETYYAQCMHYMAVTGLNKWYIAILVMGEGFYWYEIERNEDEINALIETEKDFWQHVVDKIELPIDGSETTEETLKIMFKDSGSEEEVDLTMIDTELEVLEGYKAQIKDLEEKKNEIENQVKRYMENFNKGIDDNFRISYKESKPRMKFNNKKFATDYPDLYKEYLEEGATTRTLRISKIKKVDNENE